VTEKGSSIDVDELRAIQQIVQQAIERLRSLLFELRPTALDSEGLVVALTQYLARAANETGWSFEVVDHLKGEPGPELRATLYRIALEAISNVRKHAEAAKVIVTASTEGDGVLVRVVDDGSGFDTTGSDEPVPGHIGLLAMMERAELMGGWCRVSSTRGLGTTVECWLPSDDVVGLTEAPGA
jgi:signal transduction histidine kinase